VFLSPHEQLCSESLLSTSTPASVPSCCVSWQLLQTFHTSILHKVVNTTGLWTHQRTNLVWTHWQTCCCQHYDIIAWILLEKYLKCPWIWFRRRCVQHAISEASKFAADTLSSRNTGCSCAACVLSCQDLGRFFLPFPGGNKPRRWTWKRLRKGLKMPISSLMISFTPF